MKVEAVEGVVTADFISLLRKVRMRSRMFLPSGRYDVLVGFVCGCDAASDGKLLDGFTQWINLRVVGAEHGAVAWPWVIAFKSWPAVMEKGNSLADVPEHLNDVISNNLFEFLDEFLSGQAEVAES